MIKLATCQWCDPDTAGAVVVEQMEIRHYQSNSRFTLYIFIVSPSPAQLIINSQYYNIIP